MSTAKNWKKRLIIGKLTSRGSVNDPLPWLDDRRNSPVRRFRRGADPPPDFSGTWEPVELSETAFSAAVQTVSHTATALTYGHASSGGGHKFVYKLDGSENHSTLMNIRSVAKVSVDGDKLTISRVDTYRTVASGRAPRSGQSMPPAIWSLTAPTG